MQTLNVQDLFDLDGISNRDQFRSQVAFDYLGSGLERWVLELLTRSDVTDRPVARSAIPQGVSLQGPIYVAPGAIVEPGAMIIGPVYIEEGAEVRHTAYIRGPAYVGRGAVVGHATEVKGSIFLDGAKAGHFAYVGDSILGRDTNLGAGTKLANLKIDGSEVHVRAPSGSRFPSGLRKLGALMGDRSQTGCNAVLNPGTILMPDTAVLACASYKGTLTSGFGR